MLLDPILGWALDLPLWVAILALAGIITVIMNVIYVMVTDQKEMRRLKARMKEMQQEIKDNRSNQKKAMQVQKKMMKTNMEYSKKSLKPTLYTLIPIFIVFAWMAANLAYAPVMPGDYVEFSVEMEEPAILELSQDVTIMGEASKETIERQTSWSITAQESTNFTVTNQDGESITRQLVIGKSATETLVSHNDPFDQSTIEYPKATPFGDFEMFGYRPGWLFTYIFFSVVLSILIRKGFRIA